MNKAIIKIVLLLGICTSAFAQRDIIDSLNLKLKSTQGSEKIDVYNALMAEYICQKDSLAQVYYSLSMSQLDSMNYPKGKLTALRYYGSMKYCLGELDSAIYYLRAASKIGLNYSIKKETGQVLSKLGYYFQTSGKFDSSEYYFKKGLNLAKESGDSLTMGSTSIGLGTLYQHRGQLDIALKTYFEALRIAEKIDHKPLIITTKLNISTFYYDHQPEKLRISNFLELLKITRDIGDKSREISVLEWLGYLEADSAEYELAVNYFNEGLSVNKTVKDLNSEILLLQGISYVHNLSGNHKESILANNKIIELALSSGYELYLPSMYANNVSNYLALNNYKEAIQSAIKSKELGQKSNQIELYYKILPELAIAYSKLGLNDKAYETQLEYTQLNKKIFDKEKSKQLTEIETKYETEKKEIEIASLSQQAQIQSLQLTQQKYLLVGSLVLLVLVLGGSFLFYKQRKTKQEQALTAIELEEAKKRIVVEKQYRESELKALRSQMNPHFIFNALNSIQEYIMSNEKKLAGKYLGKFADLMRTYLEHTKSKNISVNEETETLSLYLELEKLRFEDSLEFVLDVDDNVDTHLLSIPALLIQPYVENALKHGLLHKKGDRKLSISFRCIENAEELVCKIIDNGVGRKRADEINRMRNPNHKSFATSATNSRIELLNFNNKNKISVETIDLKDDKEKPLGTMVVLKIPV